MFGKVLRLCNIITNRKLNKLYKRADLPADERVDVLLRAVRMRAGVEVEEGASAERELQVAWAHAARREHCRLLVRHEACDGERGTEQVRAHVPEH